MKKRITLIVFSVLIIAALYVLYCFNYIPHKKYTNADFNIEAYKSNIDKDNDGIDDQTDILNNANNYIKTNPKYKSKYYNTGYPNDEYGVCTDVVAFALKDAGYDLMELVNEDIKNNKELYDKFYENKDTIQSAVTFPLCWDRLETKKASLVCTYINGLNFEDNSNYNDLMTQIVKLVLEFKNVFKQYV